MSQDDYISADEVLRRMTPMARIERAWPIEERAAMEVEREDYDYLVELIYEMSPGEVVAPVFQARPGSPRVELRVVAQAGYRKIRAALVNVPATQVLRRGRPDWYWEVDREGDGYQVLEVFDSLGEQRRHVRGEYPLLMQAISECLGIVFRAL